MRIVIASVLAATLAVSTAMADTATLAPGKPAGVKQADIATIPLIGLLGAAALVGVLVGITSNSGGYKNTFSISTTATAA